MVPNHTPRHRAGNEAPEPKGDNVIELNDLARRRRSWRRTERPMRTEPRGGTVLAYFWHGACLQVSYGSTTSLWLKSAHTKVHTASFAAYDELEYTRFAHLAWSRRNGSTTFTYNGLDANPSWLPMHSPEEALIARKALLAYWHFTDASGRYRRIDPSEGIMLNPDPEYFDPDAQPRGVLDQ